MSGDYLEPACSPPAARLEPARSQPVQNNDLKRRTAPTQNNCSIGTVDQTASQTRGVRPSARGWVGLWILTDLIGQSGLHNNVIRLPQRPRDSTVLYRVQCAYRLLLHC